MARVETTNNCGAVVVPFFLLGSSDGEVRRQSQCQQLMATAVTAAAANGGGMVAIPLERLRWRAYVMQQRRAAMTVHAGTTNDSVSVAVPSEILGAER